MTTASREILLIKNGELALKGLNRGTFENVLLKNLRRRLAPLGSFRLQKAQSTIYIQPENPDADLDEACDRVSRVFGISAFSRARVVERRWPPSGKGQRIIFSPPWPAYVPSRWRRGAVTKPFP